MVQGAVSEALESYSWFDGEKGKQKYTNFLMGKARFALRMGMP